MGGMAPVAGTGSGTGGSASGSGGSASGSGGSASGSGGGANSKFSFFVTSLKSMQQLAKNEKGFGGDLRYGEATGLAGADKICREIAEIGLPGAGKKEWRAFLSTVSGGPDGGPVHAIDRVGEGPWYDRLDRLVALNKMDLAQDRPRGADPAIIDDLPNEHGVPNGVDGAPGCTRGFGMGGGNPCPDNHQILTGTGPDGRLYKASPDFTCNDWTSVAPEGSPWCGHSWPREVSGTNWMSSAADGGCAPCVMLEEKGGVSADCVGSAGGYGGFYCLAVSSTP